MDTFYERPPTQRELRRGRWRLAVAALLTAGLVAGLVVLVGPPKAHASPTVTPAVSGRVSGPHALLASAMVDSNPPFRRSSDPGGYALHGVHGRRISRTIVASGGGQYRKHRGVYEYRPRWAVQGNRMMRVEFKDLTFYRHGFDEFDRCRAGCVFYGKRVVLVGQWRRVVGGEDWSTDGNVRATYLLGATSGLQGFGSYRMRAPGRYPVAGPSFW